MLPYVILCPICTLPTEGNWGTHLYLSHIILPRRMQGSYRDLTCVHSMYLSPHTVTFVPRRRELVLL